MFQGTEGSREYRLYRAAVVEGRKRALVVVLHGCLQDAADVARGTRMDAAAERSGWTVLYPEQPVTAHPQRCWNWYVPEQTERGRGEAALLAALIDSVAGSEGIARDRVVLVGLSAGAAMSGVLAVAYPERYAAIAMHSGIATAAARDAATALSMMRLPPIADSVADARARAAMGTRWRPIPVMVLQGMTDAVVAPGNADAIERQWRVINAGRAPVIVHRFAGVGHAWSGGSLEGSYTAPTGPDATGLIAAFIGDVLR